MLSSGSEYYQSQKASAAASLSMPSGGFLQPRVKEVEGLVKNLREIFVGRMNLVLVFELEAGSSKRPKTSISFIGRTKASPRSPDQSLNSAFHPSNFVS
jgi:hypothetical protein